MDRILWRAKLHEALGMCVDIIEIITTASRPAFREPLNWFKGGGGWPMIKSFGVRIVLSKVEIHLLKNSLLRKAI